MAKTLEEIAREEMGALLFTLCVRNSMIEQLQEQLAAKDAQFVAIAQQIQTILGTTLHSIDHNSVDVLFP